jgi:hypothetical protein
MSELAYEGWFEARNLKKLGPLIHLMKPFLHQATRPVDDDLLGKVGVASGDEILFFAGYHADWPLAMAKSGCKVTYTDLSPGLVWMMNNSGKGERFTAVFAANGGDQPREAGKYDWSMSFEPLPMTNGRELYDAVKRSLMNRKGGKVIARPGTRDLIAPVFERVAAETGAEYEVYDMPIKAKRRYSVTGKPIDHVIFTVRPRYQL